MTTFTWKFAAISLLMIGTAACRYQHTNNTSAEFHASAASTMSSSSDKAADATTSPAKGTTNK